MSQISDRLEANDTFLTPVLFKDGRDRRKSARIPLSAPVKMGPPGGEPYAVVSASDLSRHGLFIDADRPVKVGARFSTEIELHSGERVYISEAEVAYNRERSNSSGFGVRFVNATAEELRKIDAEIQRILAAEPKPAPAPPPPPPPSIILTAPEPEKIEDTPSAILVRKKVEAVAEDATLIPAPSLSLELGELSEPSLEGAGLELDSGFAPADEMEPSLTERARQTWEDMMAAVRNTRQRMIEGSRRVPRVWLGVAIVGTITVLTAGVLAVLGGGEVAERAPAVAEAGMEPRTQQALMGDHELGAALAPEAAKSEPAREAAPPKNPLPPLVVVEEDQVVSAPELPLVAPAKERAPKPAVKVVEKSAQKIAAKQEAPRAKQDKSGRLKIGLAQGARVLKTHVLRAPNRFVIDLTGQEGAPSLPPAGAGMKSVRYGKHAEFARLVIDTDGPISAGKVAKQGRDLLVTLDYSK